MNKLNRNSLYSLEEYSEQRTKFRSRVLAHKKNRRVQIGQAASLYFEDHLTIQYQVQEMLRIERIFEPAGIEEELTAYNPLIPDGRNWKATFMMEYSDVEERRFMLALLVGIENKVWVSTSDSEKVWAIADEDLDRTTEDKTSAVHFLRFELPEEFVTTVKSSRKLAMGIAHENYTFSVDELPQAICDSLIQDLD